MVGNLRLTKVVSENRNQFQCYFNNIGYCKYGNQCKYQHYADICQKNICTDSKCKSRHPRTCKYGGDCRFFQRKCCVYTHKSLISDQDIVVENVEKEVKELELEVMKLKETIENKEQKLLEITKVIDNQSNMISELKIENLNLKCQLTEIQSKFKNQTKLIESKDQIIDAKIDEISKLRGDFKCDKCKFCTSDLTHLVKHKANEHKLTMSCDQCNFISTKRSELQFHIVSNH